MWVQEGSSPIAHMRHKLVEQEISKKEKKVLAMAGGDVHNNNSFTEWDTRWV